MKPKQKVEEVVRHSTANFLIRWRNEVPWDRSLFLSIYHCFLLTISPLLNVRFLVFSQGMTFTKLCPKIWTRPSKQENRRASDSCPAINFHSNGINLAERENIAVKNVEKINIESSFRPLNHPHYHPSPTPSPASSRCNYTWLVCSPTLWRWFSTFFPIDIFSVGLFNTYLWILFSSRKRCSCFPLSSLLPRKSPVSSQNRLLR